MSKWEVQETTGHPIHRGATITEQVYRYLRDAIVKGELKPGERLVEQVIAEELGLSKTPVREAITRLEREGLVTTLPQRRSEVRRLSEKDVEDLMELRALLEAFAAKKAAERCDEESLAELEGCLAAMEEALADGDLERYKSEDLAFHELILEKAGSQLLAQVLARIRNQISLVMSTSVQVPGRPQASLAEHRAILQAIQARCGEETEDLTRAHLEATAETIRRAWAKKLELLAGMREGEGT